MSHFKESLILSGDLFFAAVLERIDKAQSEILAETYIFENDRIGKEFLISLTAAARRGVRVQLLVDGIGSRNFILSPPPVVPGFDIRVFHPVLFFSLHRRLFLPKVRLNFWRLLNRRNHRKIWLIDRECVFIGSLNISENHSERFKNAEAWKDAAVKIEGGEIGKLAPILQWAWKRSAPINKLYLFTLRLARRPKAPECFRVNYTRKTRRESNQKFIQQINLATKRIWIVNPYIVPSRKILRALRNAVKRGVLVEICTPKESDVFFMRWVATAFYPKLFAAGVKVWEYQRQFIHQKSALIDQTALVGSSNMNSRSLRHDLEIDVVLQESNNIKLLEDQFLTLKKDCVEFTQHFGFHDRISALLGRWVTYFFIDWI